MPKGSLFELLPVILSHEYPVEVHREKKIKTEILLVIKIGNQQYLESSVLPDRRISPYSAPICENCS